MIPFSFFLFYFPLFYFALSFLYFIFSSLISYYFSLLIPTTRRWFSSIAVRWPKAASSAASGVVSAIGRGRTSAPPLPALSGVSAHAPAAAATSLRDPWRPSSPRLSPSRPATAAVFSAPGGRLRPRPSSSGAPMPTPRAHTSGRSQAKLDFLAPTDGAGM